MHACPGSMNNPTCRSTDDKPLPTRGANSPLSSFPTLVSIYRSVTDPTMAVNAESFTSGPTPRVAVHCWMAAVVRPGHKEIEISFPWLAALTSRSNQKSWAAERRTTNQPYSVGPLIGMVRPQLRPLKRRVRNKIQRWSSYCQPGELMSDNVMATALNKPWAFFPPSLLHWGHPL